MEFEQKAEEKKMSMSKNIARLAVTAGLTAALSFGGVMAPVTMAFADGTPTVAPDGNVKIDEKTYTDTTFKGIQIFKAKVTQDLEGVNNWNGAKTLSDIEWASDAVRDAVIGAADTSTSQVQTRLLSSMPERLSTRSPRHWRTPISLKGRMSAKRAPMAPSLV